MIETLNPPLANKPGQDILSLLNEALREQQTLTAVEQFSRWHEQSPPAQEVYYRNLIPLSQPQPGEQYAFEVDLDACSGCKACVIACHHLNGLEAEETWREVGLLVKEQPRPVVQHVTTACHHCVEPGCLRGCPVKAYEKDAVTGIVRHLDDQCIGCQYCVLMCPYEVPKYSATKGIVRKCDMCRQRLAVNEAPACVQSCPNQAIRIKLVQQADARQAARNGDFLPCSPSPALTIPTTRFISQQSRYGEFTAGSAAADEPAHAHAPLTAMLVLTQLSVGLWMVERLGWMDAALGWWLQLVALLIGGFGGQLALLHLGRPLGAWRAWLGWQTSWLSREIMAFSVYAKLAAISVVLRWFWEPNGWTESIAHATLFMGMLGVFCSAMIYIATGRQVWSAGRVLGRFTLTTAILGISTAVVIDSVLRLMPGAEDAANAASPTWLWLVAPVLALVKMAFEAEVLFAKDESETRELHRSARLLRGPLRGLRYWRMALGLLGGLILPTIFMSLFTLVPAVLTPALACLLASLALASRLAGEWLERHLFFTASVAPGMPGALTT